VKLNGSVSILDSDCEWCYASNEVGSTNLNILL
jgi:hypothetical protein